MIDILDISKGIEAKSNNARFLDDGSVKKEHKFVLTCTGINNRNCEWGVKINKITGWLGVGICIKELVISNKLRFSEYKSNFQHGTYMISSNGYIWNTNNPEENNTFLQSCPKFQAGDTIRFKFEPERKYLSFAIFNKDGSKIFSSRLTKVECAREVTLVPCAVFVFPGEVTFNQLTRY
jgi:hypothetical protein